MSAATAKSRLDVLLVERGLAGTRAKAQALILAGQVLVNRQKVEKAGASIAPDADVELLLPALRYAGRGGLKLEAALNHWQIDVASLVALDIGSSTGGFTDCLLQRGAARVIAVDAGTHQMDSKLRRDPRVRLLEKTNARYLSYDQIGEQVDLVTVDVSFISATRILPVVPQFCKNGARLLALAKPQFEVGKGQVGKGGIVRDAALQQAAVAKVKQAADAAGFANLEDFACPVLGAEGNQEFFVYGRLAR